MKEQTILTEEAFSIEHLILPVAFISGGLLISIACFILEIGKNAVWNVMLHSQYALYITCHFTPMNCY